MARTISPAMRERSRFVGNYMREHYHGGGRAAFGAVARAAHRAFASSHGARRNPDNPDGYDFAEEVGGSALGTLLAFGVVGVLVAGICARRQQAVPPRYVTGG